MSMIFTEFEANEAGIAADVAQFDRDIWDSAIDGKLVQERAASEELQAFGLTGNYVVDIGDVGSEVVVNTGSWTPTQDHRAMRISMDGSADESDPLYAVVVEDEETIRFFAIRPLDPEESEGLTESWTPLIGTGQDIDHDAELARRLLAQAIPSTRGNEAASPTNPYAQLPLQPMRLNDFALLVQFRRQDREKKVERRLEGLLTWSETAGKNLDMWAAAQKDDGQTAKEISITLPTDTEDDISAIFTLSVDIPPRSGLSTSPRESYDESRKNTNQALALRSHSSDGSTPRVEAIVFYGHPVDENHLGAIIRPTEPKAEYQNLRDAVNDRDVEIVLAVANHYARLSVNPDAEWVPLVPPIETE